MVAYWINAGPVSGDVVHVDHAASGQFAGDRGFVFRISQVDPRPTYDGWCWLTGDQLDGGGHTVARRSIFVRRTGLRPARTPGEVSGPTAQRDPHQHRNPDPGPG